MDEKDENREGEDENSLDKRLKALEPEAAKAMSRAEENKGKTVKVRRATLEILKQKRKRTFKIQLPDLTLWDANGEESEVQGLEFEVRRPTDKERLKSLNFTQQQIKDMDPTKRDELDEDFYEFLSKMVVDPKLEPHEWRDEVDGAIIKQLGLKLVLLSVETDDGKLLDFFTLQ